MTRNQFCDKVRKYTSKGELTMTLKTKQTQTLYVVVLSDGKVDMLTEEQFIKVANKTAYDNGFNRDEEDKYQPITTLKHATEFMTYFCYNMNAKLYKQTITTKVEPIE